MAVILENEIEQALWLDIFQHYYKKKIPDGFTKAHNRLCSEFADEAILTFRARGGKVKGVTVAPVQKLTNDIEFQQTYCKDYDN